MDPVVQAKVSALKGQFDRLVKLQQGTQRSGQFLNFSKWRLAVLLFIKFGMYLIKFRLKLFSGDADDS